MIYKFKSEKEKFDTVLEIEIFSDDVSLLLTSHKNENAIGIILNKNQIFDLIGSLHNIKSKLIK